MFENHPDIIHEMIHVRIHNKFGFKEWRIEPTKDSLKCVMTLPGEILIPKYFPKLFLWEMFHFIHDTFTHFIALDSISIVSCFKEYIMTTRKIIKNLLIKGD